MLRLYFALFMVVSLAGCSATGTGLGSGVSVTPSTGQQTTSLKQIEPAQPPLEVLVMSYVDSVQLARDAAVRGFEGGRVEVQSDLGLVGVGYRSFWRGDIRVLIEPKIVRNMDDPSDFGITYEVKSEGVGGNMSLIPGYGVEVFLQSVGELRASKGIQSKTLQRYEILVDKSIVDSVPASIPTTYAGFKSFLEQNPSTAKYEGIWVESTGQYTLGLISTPTDRQFPYKAFVLESKVATWKPGEVKIKFRQITDGGLATGSLFIRNKAEVGATWRTDGELMELVASPIQDLKVVLVKQQLRLSQNQPLAPAVLSPTPTATAPLMGKRLALVIGNASYKIRPLLNPRNDADDVSRVLRSTGFEVIDLRDANLAQMRASVRQFGERLMSNDVGLVYYSGHGIEVKGKNYFIPVNTDIKVSDEVADQALDVSLILAKMDSAKKGVNILIVDACRDDPFGRSFRSNSRGLATMDAPQGTLIAYATAPGSVAADGTGRNSPFTKHLVRAMQVPNTPIELMFKEVRRAVREETKNQQTPWENSSLIGNFYFSVKK